MTLSKDEEETELFLEDYINQIRMMNKMGDLQIKVLMRRLMIEEPEWFDLLRQRFKTKQLRTMKNMANEIYTDNHGSIENLARKVA